MGFKNSCNRLHAKRVHIVFLVLITFLWVSDDLALAQTEPEADANPWDYFIQEVFAGAGISAAGMLASQSFSNFPKNPVYFIAGGLIGAPLGVWIVGKMNKVRGNLVLAALGGFLGWLIGYGIAFGDMPVERGVFVVAGGAGLGAAIGFNLGATVITPEP